MSMIDCKYEVFAEIGGRVHRNLHTHKADAIRFGKALASIGVENILVTDLLADQVFFTRGRIDG
jgi:hypothetical protein